MAFFNSSHSHLQRLNALIIQQRQEQLLLLQQDQDLKNQKENISLLQNNVTKVSCLQEISMHAYSH
jgi:hypothetical protein